MNFYERKPLVDKMDRREKVEFIHLITEELNIEHNDCPEVVEYIEALKNADKIFTDNNHFCR